MVDLLVLLTALSVVGYLAYKALFKPHTSPPIRRIPQPVLGFLCFGDADSAELEAADRRAFSHVFPRVADSDPQQTPICNVLFLYGHVGEDGTVYGSGGKLTRQIAADAGASILVLASPNPVERFAKARGESLTPPVNFVYTVDRNGEGFSRMLGRVFDTMLRTGKAMPVAWVEVAPLHSKTVAPGTPQMGFMPEGLGVSFK